MAQLGDALVYFPNLSQSSSNDAYGSYVSAGPTSPAAAVPEVYLRTVMQCHTATMYFRFLPGAMTGAFVLAPANPSRKKLSILNSGSLLLAIEHGAQNFNPNLPPSPTNNWDNYVAGTQTIGNTVPSYVAIEQEPAYCGVIMGAWVGSGTLSASSVIVADYS